MLYKNYFILVIDYEIIGLGMTDPDAHHNKFHGLNIYEFSPPIEAATASNFESTVESQMAMGGNVKTKKRPLYTSASACVKFFPIPCPI
jgi:hypothetical protein